MLLAIATGRCIRAAFCQAPIHPQLLPCVAQGRAQSWNSIARFSPASNIKAEYSYFVLGSYRPNSLVKSRMRSVLLRAGASIQQHRTLPSASSSRRFPPSCSVFSNLAQGQGVHSWVSIDCVSLFGGDRVVVAGMARCGLAVWR
jgi:hypothetical protein